MLETKKEECSTCETGFAVRVCSNCARGSDAWRIWFHAAPAEVKNQVTDHTGRVSVENKRLIDGILDAEFGGLHTVKNIDAAAALHIQRQADLAHAQLLARETAAASELLARNLAADRHLAARFQRHADLAAQKTLRAKIKRLLCSLLTFASGCQIAERCKIGARSNAPVDPEGHLRVHCFCDNSSRFRSSRRYYG